MANALSLSLRSGRLVLSPPSGRPGPNLAFFWPNRLWPLAQANLLNWISCLIESCFKQVLLMLLVIVLGWAWAWVSPALCCRISALRQNHQSHHQLARWVSETVRQQLTSYILGWIGCRYSLSLSLFDVSAVYNRLLTIPLHTFM